jgi:hypothetical protein
MAYDKLLETALEAATGLNIFANRSTSLRAAGSRECAPGVRSNPAKRTQAGLPPPSLFELRRTRSSQELLAMTVEMLCRNTSVTAYQQPPIESTFRGLDFETAIQREKGAEIAKRVRPADAA